jgi:transposase-like protein
MDEPKNLPQTLIEAICYFSDQDVCVQFVAKLRWPDGPICPTCGGTEHSYLTTRRVWKCKACKRQFSVKVGSIFEDSAIPLDKWLAAMWMIANSKNGVSSHKMARSLGITQKSAWFLLHRIRLAMQTGTFAKLDGEIEVDETFIGGKARNMHKSKRAKKITGTGGNDKAIVAGVLQRGGEVRAVVVSDTRRATLQAGVRQHVEKGAVVYSDALQSYNGLAGEYDHKVVDHAEKYVDGQVHVNGVENFWSLLKRGLHGTYVSVQPWHLFRYMDEQVFTYNERDLTDPRPLPGGAGHGCRAQTDLQGVDRQGRRWTA